MIGKSSQADMLSRLLQQVEQKQQVVSQNIANVNTPGYRTLEAAFKDVLADQAAGSEPGEMSLVEVLGLPEREDGNNVDLDRQLGELTENSMQFEAFTHLLVARFSMMRSAITGR